MGNNFKANNTFYSQWNIEELSIISKLMYRKFGCPKIFSPEELLEMDQKEAETLYMSVSYSKDEIVKNYNLAIKYYNQTKLKDNENFNEEETLNNIVANWNNLSEITKAKDNSKTSDSTPHSFLDYIYGKFHQQTSDTHADILAQYYTGSQKPSTDEADNAKDPYGYYGGHGMN